MRNALFSALLLLSLARPLHAATPRDQLVVDAKWLLKHAGDPNLVLLQVGDQESFDAGHIAGARRVVLADLHVSDHSATGLMLEMPTAEELRTRLEALGVSDDSRIVVYFGRDWVSPATRVLFTLQYAGLGARSSLLDGGLPAWARSGGSVTKEATVAKKGHLSPLRIQPIVVDGDTVRARLGAQGYAVVDGRASVFYDGIESGEDRGGKQRAGHVPGALSVPFTEITDDQLMLKSDAELRALFTKAGVAPHDTVIGYCHIGQQASLMLFAARLLGHPVLLYDGSYQDWSRHADWPVENPAGASR